MTYLTFDRPVRLPHATLGAGTYIFEVGKEVGPGSRVVRVLNRERSKTHFVGFARVVARPVRLARDQSFLFGDATPGVAVPIIVWYPKGEPTGLRFIYSERR